METLTTGELARRADVHVETVRYYERRGLLPEPPRTAAGYRQYGQDDLRRLRFIRRAQELGFQLEEIRDLLNLRVEEDRHCGEVQEHAEGAIVRIDEQVRQLSRMKRALSSLVEACRQRRPTDDCPILLAIEGAEDDGQPTAD